MNCPPCEEPSYLPITTGRIGLSQTTGGLEFYGHNYHGRGIQLFYGKWCEPCPPCPPRWAPPQWNCPPPSCGCGGCGCASCCSPCNAGANCFASLLTNVYAWCGYWTAEQQRAWLCGQQPWPATNIAAQQALAASLPAACLPVCPPPAPIPVAA